MIRAVIFDADGPLYDRSEHVAELKVKLLHDFGFDGPLKQFQQLYEERKLLAYVGKETIAEMFQYILSGLGISLDSGAAENFAARFNTIQSQVTITPDAYKTLKSLKQRDVKVCVLTDSFYEAKEKTPWFDELGIGQFIDGIISSFDTKFLKDTAEAYLACLNLLDVPSSEAIFVGHQQYEMDGAKKAGVISVAVGPIAASRIKADYTVRSISEVPALISKL